MNARQSTEKHAKTLTDLLVRMQAAAAELPQRKDLNWGHAGQTHDALRWTVYAAFALGVVNEDEARDILREAPGIMVVDKREPGGYVTPVECVGDYATFVSRVREDPTVENGLVLWCVSDNLRKGAALNAVQIAELLGRRHLKKG